MLIAIINGIQVIGSPEEIERYRQITAKKETFTGFNIPDINIPDHVKTYGKNDMKFVLKHDTKITAWY